MVLEIVTYVRMADHELQEEESRVSWDAARREHLGYRGHLEPLAAPTA